MALRTFADYAESGEIKSIIFDTTITGHVHAEGRIGYDATEKTHISQDDIEETTLNIGKEQFIRVINLTGVDIANGKAVRHDGVDPTTELPKIQLALADSLTNARILGIVTGLILDGEEGTIATFGKVRDLDTSLLTQGLPVYLSDVDPGDFVETPPSIVTQVGGILRSDAATGILFAKISNVISLPTLFGIMEIINDAYNLTTSYQDLVDYQSSDSISMVLDELLGTMELPNDGLYRLTFNITMTVPTSTGTRSVTINARNNTAAADEVTYVIPIPRDTTEVSRSFAVPFRVVADDIIVMQIKSDVVISGVTIDSVSYDIESISLTS